MGSEIRHLEMDFDSTLMQLLSGADQSRPTPSAPPEELVFQQPEVQQQPTVQQQLTVQQQPAVQQQVVKQPAIQQQHAVQQQPAVQSNMYPKLKPARPPPPDPQRLQQLKYEKRIKTLEANQRILIEEVGKLRRILKDIYEKKDDDLVPVITYMKM